MTHLNNVPVEDDTEIKYSTITKLGKYDVRYERWAWEAIYAESLIFINDDIEDTSEDELKELIINSELHDGKSEITVKRTDDFTYFNFNFKELDDLL